MDEVGFFVMGRMPIRLKITGRMPVLHGAVLHGAVLHGAVLHGAVLHGDFQDTGDYMISPDIHEKWFCRENLALNHLWIPAGRNRAEIVDQ